MQRSRRRLRFERCANRRGAALMFCMFILAVMVLMVVNVVDTTTLELSALRNAMEYERALYLANAGVHHAAATIEADVTWRGVASDGAYPADNSYFAEASDGPDNTVIVTARGVAGEITRSVQAVIEL